MTRRNVTAFLLFFVPLLLALFCDFAIPADSFRGRWWNTLLTRLLCAVSVAVLILRCRLPLWGAGRARMKGKKKQIHAPVPASAGDAYTPCVVPAASDPASSAPCVADPAAAAPAVSLSCNREVASEISEQDAAVLPETGPAVQCVPPSPCVADPAAAAPAVPVSCDREVASEISEQGAVLPEAGPAVQCVPPSPCVVNPAAAASAVPSLCRTVSGTGCSAVPAASDPASSAPCVADPAAAASPAPSPCSTDSDAETPAGLPAPGVTPSARDPMPARQKNLRAVSDVPAGAGCAWPLPPRALHIAAIVIAFAVACNNLPILSLLQGSAYLTASLPDILLFACGCLSVALFEELLFRGLLFPLLLRHFPDTRGGRLLALLLSSVAFALLHLLNLPAAGPAALLQVGYSFLIGCLTAVLFLLGRGLLLPVLFHALYNFCGMLVPNCGTGLLWDLPTVVLTVLLSLLAAALLGAAYFTGPGRSDARL